MNLYTKLVAIASASILLLTTVGCSAKKDDDVMTMQYPSQNYLIEDVYTDKSDYKPNDTVNITLSLKNKTKEDFNGKLSLSYKILTKSVNTQDVSIALKKGESKDIKCSWKTPSEDFQGYLLEVKAIKNGAVEDQRNTAIDVSSDWSKFPRYGYLCNYDNVSPDKIKKTMDRLCKYHINGLQFYDWQNSHDQPLAGTVSNPTDKWKDIANRDTYASTIKGYITECHERNMMAANYNLMFAAYNDYENRGIKKEWALYKDMDHDMQDSHELPTTWASNLNLMNPGNTDWQNFLISKEKDVFNVYDFDVFHVDTLGNRGIRYDYDGNKIDLAENYTGFLDAAKKQLNKKIVMNAVNGYGTQEAASVDTDFLYTEVWPDTYPNYSNLKGAVDSNTKFSSGRKASVIAAYMNYKVSGHEFNENAVKLTDAVIFASGGSHLELGDSGMLSSEYFPNEKMFLSDGLTNDLRCYYDFLVAYEDILHQQIVWKDINAKYGKNPVSSRGDSQNVWVFGSESEKFDTVQMINMLSRKSEDWRDDSYSCEKPKVIENTDLSIDYKAQKVSGVYLASPDIKGGSMFKLDYTLKDGKLSVKIPELKYWDMIVIEK